MSLVIVGLSLIAWDQSRRSKPKPHDVKTLKGRTLKLRDDLQKFLDDTPQSEKIEKRPNETLAESFKRTGQAIMPRVYKIIHGYELRFSSRVDHIYHEFGERGVNDFQLATLMERPYRDEEAVNAIIKELSELAEMPEAVIGDVTR